MNDYLEDMKLLERAAREGGAVAMKYYGTDVEVEYKPEAGNSPVTEADKATDVFLNRFLLENRPDYGWLSEELEDDLSRLERKRVFIVDPIDGTKGFLNGGDFALSLAVAEGGEVVASVVFNPVKNEMFAAAKKFGAFLNGEKFEVVKCDDLVGQSCYNSYRESRKGYWAGLEDLFTLIPLYSVAYKLAKLVEGDVLFFGTFTPKNEWDIAAGHLLCNEVGVKVADLFGEEPFYNTSHADKAVRHLIAAPENVFEDFRSLMLAHGEKLKALTAGDSGA